MLQSKSFYICIVFFQLIIIGSISFMYTNIMILPHADVRLRYIKGKRWDVFLQISGNSDTENLKNTIATVY